MAENRFLSIIGLSKKAVTPTQTLGTSRDTLHDGSAIVIAGERNPALIGRQRYDTFDKIVRDCSIVAAGTRLFLSMISNAVWTVNPPEDLNENEKPVAQEYADMAYDILFDMTSSWSSVVKKTAMFRMIGFSLQEWTAKKREDGVIGLLDIEHRPQRTITRWIRDEGGTVEAIVQRVSGRQDVEIPRGKLVYAVDDFMNDSPEGMGLLRHMAPTADRLDFFLDLEEVGYETDLRGIPVASVPMEELADKIEEAGLPGSDERAREIARRERIIAPFKNFIENHVRNRKTGILKSSETYIGKSVDKSDAVSQVPKYSIELLQGESSAFGDMANAINRMNQELARIIGCEHLLLGSDGVGSLALAKSKIGTFYQTVTSTLYDLLEIFDRDILEVISELNNWPEELRPQMGVNEITEKEISDVMDALQKLATAGAPLMPDDPAVGEVYDMMGLTRPPEREDDMGMSLLPRRNEPGQDPTADPNQPTEVDPEAPVKKSNVLRSRRHMKKRRR